MVKGISSTFEVVAQLIASAKCLKIYCLNDDALFNKHEWTNHIFFKPQIKANAHLKVQIYHMSVLSIFCWPFWASLLQSSFLCLKFGPRINRNFSKKTTNYRPKTKHLGKDMFFLYCAGYYIAMRLSYWQGITSSYMWNTVGVHPQRGRFT